MVASSSAASSGSPIERADRFTSARRPRLASATPWATIQRSMTPISPQRSTSGRNSAGLMTSSGSALSRRRTRSSSWATVPRRWSRIGCV